MDVFEVQIVVRGSAMSAGTPVRRDGEPTLLGTRSAFGVREMSKQQAAPERTGHECGRRPPCGSARGDANPTRAPELHPWARFWKAASKPAFDGAGT